MNRVVISLLLFLSLASEAGILNQDDFSSPELFNRYRLLTKELRCLVCQNQNLASSDAPLAANLRTIIFEQLEHGSSDDQIRQFMVDRYGKFVLYDPPFEATTLLLWLGPALLLFIAAIFVILFIGKQARAIQEE